MTKLYESTASLASIYQAKKSGDTTVNVLKQQFQSQIERKQGGGGVVKSIGPISGSVQTEREVVRKLTREKSFDEARTAVQSHIEKIFQKAAAKGQEAQGHGHGPPPGPARRYTMHGVSHLTPDEVPVISPLPMHGITLQALLEKRRKEEISIGSIVEESKENSATSTLRSIAGHEPQSMLPFRIHNSRGSTISRHYSIDNLALQEETYARQKYTSMMNLSNATPGNKSMTSTSSSRGNKGPKPTPGFIGMVHAPVMMKATDDYYDDVPAPPRRVLPPIQAEIVGGQARDANLQHLGRMSPEEQLDKFLQSVEEVNAENEKILKGEGHPSPALKAAEPIVLQSPPKVKNLRRESSIASRWHSMESVNTPSKSRLNTARKPPAPKVPSANLERPRTKSPSKPLAPSSPAKMTKRRAPQPTRVGFREVYGPKSSSSMSQLDSLRGEEESLTSETPSFMKMKKPLAPASFSSGRYSENSSSKSTLQHDASQRNAKPKAPRAPSSVEKSIKNRGLGPRAKSDEALSGPAKLDVNGNNQPMAKPRHKDRASKVIYLGSIPLSTQASDMSSLQLPLKNLYFNYIEQISKGVEPLASSLQITETGLKINYIREKQKGVQEIFNPFPTIAVWAAVRFVYKRKLDANFQFAFLPLISDPGDAEKNQLFSPLPSQDLKHAASTEHPSMFACIMRRNGTQKKLECHGFVCHSKDEAVSIASNLYDSLMETMRQQLGEASTSTELSASTPTRPPRKKRRGRKTQSDETSNAESTHRGRRGDSSMQKANIKRSQSEKFLNESFESRMHRSASERRSDSDTVTKRKGDIYTKVAMPRSKSFMNVSGQYNLQELFKELKDKEGIESIDDILRHVISKEGMSFNKISPMYRELLMKLAMSMSGDEMFIRSKNIIMEDKLKKHHVGFHFKEESPLSRLCQVFGLGKRSKTNLSQSKLNKADIGQPLPVSEAAKSQLTREWMKATPELIAAKQAVQSMVKAPAPKPVFKKAVSERDSSYISCSECAYQSDCGTHCDCSMVTTTGDELESRSASTKKLGLEKRPVASPRKKNLPSSSPSDIMAVLPANGSSAGENKNKKTTKMMIKTNNNSINNPTSKTIKQQIQQMTPTTIMRVSGEECSSCSCQSLYTDGKDETTTTCSSCSSSSCASEDEVRSHHGSIDDDGVSSDGCSGSSYLESMDSPQTAWKRRNQEIQASTLVEGLESEDDEDHSTDASVRSVIQKVQMATDGHLGASSSLGSSHSKGAEHVDGFFRNLNLDSDEQKRLSIASFRNVNSKIASQQSKSGSRVSLDSLSSSSSSLSEDSMANGRRGPRPAYSEANMQNSLGYLP